ncbi:hypothetical protein NDU88_002927 [Pleurodeles waltl]|uniref:Uncharacterized protein n=1 Tax=Pleurodeles waltl TaxID=8319 RepID=A0AAV7WS34_PLEWA|nr:hypothetical protein NDU88_002927 [Pleurodeles waltl]
MGPAEPPLLQLQGDQESSASTAPTRYGPSRAPPPRVPVGLCRAREAEATCRRFPVVAPPPSPVPPRPDCCRRLLLCRRSALCLCWVRSLVTSHEAVLLGCSSRPPRPPTVSVARTQTASQRGSPCPPAGRSSDRSALSPGPPSATDPR